MVAAAHAAAAQPRVRSTLREQLEYAIVRGAMATFGVLPRSAARTLGAGVASLLYRVLGRLRSVGLRNLELAFPEMSVGERENILREEFRSLGWQLAEFPRMARLTRASAAAYIRYEGLENYLAARDKGRGVLVLTAHLGAWELSSFYHSLMGYPMSMVIRRLDNPLVDELVNGVRSMHGNRVLHKDDFARGLLTAMHRGETVGILMDTNMTPPQGVFVPFFGVDACTASGLARVALRTNAAVLPGFLVWDASEKKYVLHFGEEVALERTGDNERDIIANTARFTATLESWIRRYPGQWLWVHRRWKTRPEGAEKIYG
jgi:KDO2-lipid IV(A) lauroyltransferase